jgi:hypothetical protein
MRRTFSRAAVAAMLTLAFVLGQGTWVLAGTTGEITGAVTDSSTGRGIAGAHVAAASPSQSVRTTTDGQGRFTFLDLAPDTYSITVDAAGHQGTILNGVTVQADQIQTLALSAPPAIQTIGHTTSRAAADIVKAGQTADVYAVSAAQAAAAAALGGGASLNQAYSAIASVPGVYVPIGTQGWAQPVYVRGGNYTQLGYDYDGVPVQRAYDAYPSSTLSALGQQEVQVYTGSAPGSAQSNGLAGFVNQVIKTGTYPGTGTAELGSGTPTFYHKAQIEFGGASPNRNFSYYFGAAGYNQSQRYVDQFDGASDLYNYSAVDYAVIAHNCGMPNATAGCYSNGFGAAPNGYIWAPLTYGTVQGLGDRETVANLHFGIPHKNDGLRDDIQVLGSLSYLFETFQDSYNSFGPNAVNFFNTGVLNYNGATYPTCTGALLGANTPCVFSELGIGPAGGFSAPGSPIGFQYPTHYIYTGPTGGALTAANFSQVQQYPFPFQPGGNGFGGTVGLNDSGRENINDAIFKFQYTHAMGTNAYARMYAYSLYSDWLNNDPNGYYGLGLSNPFAEVPSDYILPTHTKGVGLTLADQIGNHLVNLTAGYSTADLSRWNNSLPSSSNPVAVLVNSTNPTAGCYSSTLALAPCESAARYTLPGTTAGTNLPTSTSLVAHSAGAITYANASTFTCGTGPCEFLTVGSGLNGSFNDVTPRFANLALQDSWAITPKLSMDIGVRYDSFRFDIPSATSPEGPNPGNASVLGRTLFTNSYNQFNCYYAGSTTPIQATTTPGVCGAGGTPVNFTNNNSTEMWYGGFEPRFGATFKVDSLNVLRLGYGKYLQPTSTAYTFYNRAGADVANYDAPKFYPFGFTSAAHAIPPEVSYNLDFSWEHQVKGSDFSWKVTPFYRKTQNEDINVILDPTTNFSSAIPALASDIKGVELLLRKGDFSRNGFAAQLSYTYTYEQSKYQILPGGTTALTNVNNSIATYNAYTSFCSTHATDKRCGTTPSGVAAAPCYTSAGAPDPTCSMAGSIANPYWNAPVQPLFDPNANYYPYNQTFGTGLVSSSNASSYNIPHVAALILNYKHDKWAFTPTMQFSAGGRYGSPIMGIGVQPDNCPAGLAGSTTGDPRYPYGAVGGAAYDAQACGPGYIASPDPYTGKFDTPGAFVEPSILTANLGIQYQASKRLTLNVTAVNLWGTCFGGSREPWTFANSKLGCSYNAATGLQSGNFYNPGNALETQSYPYFPVTGQINGQQVYGTAINPLQFFVSAQLKM